MKHVMLYLKKNSKLFNKINHAKMSCKSAYLVKSWLRNIE
jgi:hypothetical protein